MARHLQGAGLRAWYCAIDDLANPGNYFVPAWEFGDIAMGQTATRVLDFFVTPATEPLFPSDPRYDPLVGSLQNGDDILMKRTTSLKISDWVDGIWYDNDLPYPDEELGYNSNVSVFFIPEMTILPLISLAGLLALRRRR